MPSTLETCANAAARPGSPSAGDTVYQEDTKQIITYDGSSWVEYSSESASGYDLDGTNILSVSPLFHFDADKINGTDTSGNPSNGAAFTGQWTSKIKGVTTVAQATASEQPTYYTSGENSQAYLSFDGGDFLYLTTRVYFKEDFTFMTIAKGATSTSHMSPLGLPGADYASTGNNQDFGGAGPFSGRHNDVLIFYSDSSPSGYPGVASFPTGKNFHAQTRNLIFKRESAAATLFFDGDNQVSTSSNTSNVDVRVGVIGKTNYNKTTGNIYELIAFESALSSTDLNVWNAYVTTRYAAGTGAMETQDNF